MTKYLVINRYNGMHIGIDNVGCFKAESEEDAKQQAATKWYVSYYNLFAFEIDKLESGWSYFGSLS